MKATKAYIASFGTTGVLLAGSVLMLAVVSAVVAFDRWPGGEVSTRVQTLVLDEQASPIRVTSQSAAPSATPGVARSGAVSDRGPVAARPRAGTGPINAGGQLGVVERGGTPPVQGTGPVQNTLQPVVEPTYPIIEAVSNARTTAGQVADGTAGVTNAIGGGLNALDPNVGSAVSATGDAAAEAIRQLPLPDHILPGH